MHGDTGLLYYMVVNIVCVSGICSRSSVTLISTIRGSLPHYDCVYVCLLKCLYDVPHDRACFCFTVVVLHDSVTRYGRKIRLDQ